MSNSWGASSGLEWIPQWPGFYISKMEQCDFFFTHHNGVLFLNENDVLKIVTVKTCYLVSMKTSLVFKEFPVDFQWDKTPQSSQCQSAGRAVFKLWDLMLVLLELDWWWIPWSLNILLSVWFRVFVPISCCCAFGPDFPVLHFPVAPYPC